ncbi:MAG TPA: GNAT family N-acetyltransferase [Micropepsaceae bacterium]|nr:GNAT family N-acetyltransferase [Micropepsaceae bacterium]
MSLVIRKANPDDASAICRIYNPHVLKTVVTFEETEIAVPEMASRIANIGASYSFLAAEDDGAFAGYSYAARFNERIGYRYTVVTTVYVDQTMQGRGVGTALYRALLERLAAHSMHAAIGIIALPNPASIALHEKCGFRKVAHLDQAGIKFGRWIDVGYWQIVL